MLIRNADTHEVPINLTLEAESDISPSKDLSLIKAEDSYRIPTMC